MSISAINTSKFVRILASRSLDKQAQLLRANLILTDLKQARSAKSPAQSQRGYKKVHVIHALTKIPGERVDERTVLGTQKRLDHHPGLNVGLNPRDKSLYAICAGTVYYSMERFVPNKKHALVQQYYAQQDLVPFYRKYVHVVPDKLTNQFRMIDIV